VSLSPEGTGPRCEQCEQTGEPLAVAHEMPVSPGPHVLQAHDLMALRRLLPEALEGMPPMRSSQS
jgi:hypothetical protein